MHKNEGVSHVSYEVHRALSDITRRKKNVVVCGLPESQGDNDHNCGLSDEAAKDSHSSGKLAIRPDHPRRRIKIKLCMVGGMRCVVIHVKCDPNRLRSYDAVRLNMALHITLASGIYNSSKVRLNLQCRLLLILCDRL